MPCPTPRCAGGWWRTHARTFWVASTLLGPEKRRTAYALYAFCRVADDLVDSAPVQGTASVARQLADFARKLDACLAGRPGDAIFRELHRAVRAHHVPEAVLRELLDGVARDLHPCATAPGTSSWATARAWRARWARCARTCSACPAGRRRACAPCATPARSGVAMQLTNILRDVGEDARRGRCYLPEDELAAFGLSPTDVLKNSAIPPRRAVAARSWPSRSAGPRASTRRRAGLALLAPDAARCAAACAIGYAGILGALERIGYDAINQRARLGRGAPGGGALAGVALAAAARRRGAPRRGAAHRLGRGADRRARRRRPCPPCSPPRRPRRAWPTSACAWPEAHRRHFTGARRPSGRGAPEPIRRMSTAVRGERDYAPLAPTPPRAAAAPASPEIAPSLAATLVRVAAFCLIGHAALSLFSAVAFATFLSGPPPAWLARPENQVALKIGWTFGPPTTVVLGALAGVLHAMGRLGVRRALLIFAFGFTISLASELAGTGTGYPFGSYSYSGLLGYKIGGLVPFNIPTSWFFMLYASLAICGRVLTARDDGRTKLVWAVVAASSSPRGT
jgi:phytoene/squalene synthetase